MKFKTKVEKKIKPKVKTKVKNILCPFVSFIYKKQKDCIKFTHKRTLIFFMLGTCAMVISDFV